MLFSSKIAREDAWALLKSFPKRDKNRRFYTWELSDRLLEARMDFDEGRTRTEDEMNHYMDNLLASLAS